MKAKLKYWILTSIIVFTSFYGLSAQTKFDKKLEKLILQEKFDKCINKSNKLIVKQKYKHCGLYFKSLATFKLYNCSGTRNDSLRFLKKSISLINTCERNKLIEKYPESYPNLYTEIKLATTQIANNLFNQGDKRNSKYFYNKLASIFKDTTAQYLVFNAIEPKVENSLDATVDSIFFKRIEIIKMAEALVGIPYVYGGESKKGLDCSGFTQFVYKKAGIELPHNANMQSQLGERIDLADTKPGDLIFFGNEYNGNFRAYHAGLIYKNENGNIDLIHCVSRGVTIDKNGDSANGYWLKKNFIVKRILN